MSQDYGAPPDTQPGAKPGCDAQYPLITPIPPAVNGRDAKPESPAPPARAAEPPSVAKTVPDPGSGNEGETENVEDDGDEEEEEPLEVPKTKPPLKMTAGAIYKRLNRLTKPRANGTMKVPAEVADDYNDPARRSKVMLLFEKCGYETDRV